MRHKTRCPKVRTVHRSFFDRLILPRVEQYAINHDVHDLDATVNYLRTNYREYRRHKEDPFRKIVLRAIQTLQHNSNHQKRKCNSLHEEEEEEEEEDEEEEEASSSRESDSNGNSKERQESQGGLEVKLKKEDKGFDSRVMFKDLGGLSGVINEVMEIIYPLFHPEIYPWLGVQPMKGILLHGPPGCGKTKLAHAIANEAGVPFYKISATEVVSGVSGESEENIRNLFSKALKTAPAIIFIDEIDAISAKRENLQREMERRIVVQLLTCMDESHETMISADQESDAETPKKKSGHVLVIGATNRPDALDPALRRPGRFDREIVLGVPDENSRVEILSVITRGLRLEGSFDFKKIAKCTPGFVGADLTALTREAASVAIKRIIASRNPQNLVKCGDIEVTEYAWWKKAWTQDEMNNLSITMADFEEAATKVQPSTRREGFSAIPNVKWDDVGALSSLRKDFEMYVVRRIKHPEEYEALGMDLDNGFLLYGPPGCGKTLVAKAVANEAGSNFIHIKGPELLNKYVGESELAIRTIFTRARTCSPCILFFDEIDALTTKRGKDGGWVVERLLNQLLIEMDGSEKRKGVFVIGATNRPEVMDPAVLRPGRFGKLLYVPIPDAEGRVSILKTLTRKRPLSAEVDLNYIGHSQSCENFSGADLAALVNEACMCALQEKIAAAVEADSDVRKYALVVNLSHFEQAFKRVVPSVSKVQRHYYEQWLPLTRAIKDIYSWSQAYLFVSEQILFEVLEHEGLSNYFQGAAHNLEK
ncbi:hypothetical protein SUGI_1049620 [Cryptomeria japonica]|nr:hypothetical protein SUGI_1049620 [Cryptomeria japonica]